MIGIVFFMEYLIFESSDELVQHDSQQDTNERSHPVDLVVFSEGVIHDAWSEKASWVQ